MENMSSFDSFIEQFAAFATDLAASAPEHVGKLAGLFGQTESLFPGTVLDAVLRSIRELETAGPERLAELLATLLEWESSDGGLGEKLRPLVEGFSTLLATVQLEDVGPQFDAAVMPWLERLGEACVSAIMGDS
ncbi:MAG: hypothetical protein ACJAYU_005303 [Bradymonadia bacterium]|jgi:hypothetical protein